MLLINLKRIFIIMVYLKTILSEIFTTSGIDLLQSFEDYQQDTNSMPCIALIVEKYLLKAKTNAGSIIIINFPPISPVFFNSLVKYFTINSNYRTTIVAKHTHSLKGDEKQQPFVYKSTSYFLCINDTTEVEETIR